MWQALLIFYFLGRGLNERENARREQERNDKEYNRQLAEYNKQLKEYNRKIQEQNCIPKVSSPSQFLTAKQKAWCWGMFGVYTIYLIISNVVTFRVGVIIILISVCCLFNNLGKSED